MCVGDDYETDKYLITVDSIVEKEQKPGNEQNKAPSVALAPTAKPKTVPAFSNKLAGSKSRKVGIFV